MELGIGNLGLENPNSQFLIPYHIIMRKKVLILIAIIILNTTASSSQVPLSFSADLGIQHNFKKQQQYWAVGSHLQLCFHLTPRDGIYGWFGLHTNGKFANRLQATAKSTTTVPQVINYNDTSRMRFQHISIGWKKFIKGLPTNESGWNLYTSAGFGLMLGLVNNYSTARPDSLFYDLPISGGEGRFKRLTLDLGLGVDFPLAADVYAFGEGRVFIPTTDYPSKYIFINEKAPFIAWIGAGLRILF